MKTTTMSRILLSIFVLVLIGFALVWLTGPYQIFGLLAFLAGVAALVWVWLPVLRKTA